MYFRLQSSCNYHLYDNFFEVKSDIFKLNFKIKGIPTDLALKMLDLLENGVEEENFLELLVDFENNLTKKILTFIEFLKKKGLLIYTSDNAISSPENKLYDRQVRFLNTFENASFSGADFNEKLQTRKIVIIGLGAYGSWLALHSSRLGINRIVGIDFDEVELSNLHRQVVYTSADIGVKKVDAIANFMVAADSSIRYEAVCKKIESEIDLYPYIDDADLVFNSFGYYPVAESVSMIPGIIAKACIFKKKPMLCLSTNWLGPLYLPEKSACYFCAVMNPKIEPILQKSKKNPRIDKRSFCPIIAMTCSLAAIEAVRFLTDINIPSSLNGLRYIDPFNIESSKFFPIEKNSQCPFCS